MNDASGSFRFGLIGLVALVVAACSTGPTPSPDSIAVAAWADSLSVRFEGRRGQIEVGGPYVGAEFHGSRPLPTRISFYNPVANSIDLSTGYWERAESSPFNVSLSVDGTTTALGAEAATYTWAPHRVRFERIDEGNTTLLSYGFAQDLPVMIFRLTVVNTAPATRTFEVTTRLVTSLRSSHRFAMHDRAVSAYTGDGGTFTADFTVPDTDAAHVDSARVFVTNVGDLPTGHGEPESPAPEARFVYRQKLAPGDSLEVVQLIGSEGQGETFLDRARREWAGSETALETEIVRYTLHREMDLPDAGLERSARMAKVLLRANRHHLAGRIVPMPCPAEYNFFFTHDLLVTDLGAVRFDNERVRDDLRYLLSLSDSSNVLPHAYYWRDGAYVLEPTGDDNWNHLWFMILGAAYLQHSGDLETVRALYPMMSRSLETMRANEKRGLMVAIRPDWWDIGHLAGGRAYLTSLMIRAIEAYSYVSLRLGRDADELAKNMDLARRMRGALVERLWDDEAGYLLNELDSTRMDRHFYSGSLVAAAFGLLDAEKTTTLIETARRELLDENLGIRNAMPPDFHTLIDTYQFNGEEAGAPYLYMNGGIWTQGSAWYAQALLAAGRPDEARTVLTRYLSLEGTIDSPNGQPAFFEYRNGDPSSPRYGEVDKPTFLWAGGWYLNVLYGLAGVRQSAWNLSFDPGLPTGFETIRYDLMVEGVPSRVTWSGTGDYFADIRLDGEPVHSAVLFGAPSRIDLRRGWPSAPYLASAGAIVRSVTYDEGRSLLRITVDGVPGQVVELRVVTPRLPSRDVAGIVKIDGAASKTVPTITVDPDGVATVCLSTRLVGRNSVVELRLD